MTADTKELRGSENSPPAPIPEPASFSRELSGSFNGAQIRYLCIANETFIRDENAVPKASFFTTAYLRSDVENGDARPVMFVFNGGPGSSTQWLHMGLVGPRRVVVPSQANNGGAPPYSIVDNPLSILDACDLVAM